jgi:hypothetical protein
MALPTEPPEEELVSLPVIREDVRQLLLAASEQLEMIRQVRGPEAGKRLDQAIWRVTATADSADWQPKYPSGD